jgi:hypothetical protein
MVEGAAGTGKTWWTAAFIRACKEHEKAVRKAGYTHCCAALFGAQTIARILYQQENLRDTVFIIDEMGLVPAATWGLLARYMLLDASFVLLGDWRGQFEPFGDRYGHLGSIEDSALLHSLCGGVRIRLEEYKRGTDPALFDFYYGLYDRPDEELPYVVQESVARFPVRAMPTASSICLVMRHVQRLELNRLINEAVKPVRAVHCALPDFRANNACTMQPQEMHIWPDLVLLGCARGITKKTCANAGDVIQGVAYRVKEISNDSATLWMVQAFGGAHDPAFDSDDHAPLRSPRADEDDPEEVPPDEARSLSGRPLKLTVPLKDLPLLFRLMHAMCYYTSQGRTFQDQDVFLCDTGRMQDSYGKRALIVGLSRATHVDLVHVVGDQEAFANDLRLRCING